MTKGNSNFVTNARISKQVRLDAAMVFFFIATFRLPQLLSPASNLLISLTIAALLAVYAGFIVFRNKFVIKHVSKPRLLLVVLYLGLELLSFMRAGIEQSLDSYTVLKTSGLIITLSIFMFFSISNMRSKEDLFFFMRVVFYGFVVLALENLFLYLVGIGSFQTGTEYSISSLGVLTSALGLEVIAATFGLEAAPKALGSMLIFLVAASIIFLREGKNNVIFVLTLIFCSGMIVASDARFYSVMILLLVTISVIHKKLVSKKILKLYLLFYPLIPLLLLVIASFVADLPGFDIVSRNASDNISTLSNRTLIWAAIGDEILEANIQLVHGYGAAGTVNSGINSEIAFVFVGGWENTGVKTAHNSIFQVLLDKGLIGVLVLLALLRSLLMTYRSSDSPESRAFLYGLLALMLSSTINTLFHYAGVESYALFLILVGIHLSTFFDHENSDEKLIGVSIRENHL